MMAAMETVQLVISAGANIVEATQLSNDLSRLRTSLPKSRLLIYRAEWGRFKNKELVVLLSQLKDTTYDAEDLLREFDDQVLRQKMEDTDRSRAFQLASSSFNLIQNCISGYKTRVQEAQNKLDIVVNEIEGALDLMGLNVELVQHMPETSSVIGVPEVMGRDEERDIVIEMLGVMIGRENQRDQVMELLGVPLTRCSRSAGSTVKKTTPGTGVIACTSKSKRLKGKSSSFGPPETICTGNVCVLPIVGIGGVGKTTLAQFIYNDARVKAHFDLRIWVCVSDLFDKRRITNEIIESIPGAEFNPSSSLNNLHGQLMEQLKGHKFLLVLDDIWPNANGEWEAFYAPLRYGCEGSTVLVTTRFPKVADFVTTVKPVQLEGLPTDIFWEFFKKCAFGSECPESYPQLHDIGQSIVTKLCGSPLAAKTLGRLLSGNLTEEHWRGIQNNELWELSYEENDILPALQLSYLYLPQELKRCFAVCSMYPKDYSFERDEMVEFWVAQGFIGPLGSMRLEDIGGRYLDDLRSRFLFQTDPKFLGQTRYVMHDLIHDMAQSVSASECFLMQDSSYQNKSKMPETIRNMSIELDNEDLSRMKGIDHSNKLHSLRFGTRFKVDIPWFNQLSNILFLSLKGCELLKLPESICALNHLRHLDISHSHVQELPEKLWCLYSLQVIDAGDSRLHTIDEGVTKLVNLRRLALPATAAEELSNIRRLGNLSSLQNLSYFTAAGGIGREIGELKCMNQLRGTLSIRCIVSVKSWEEASEARLIDKQYLKALVLQWGELTCNQQSADKEFLEGLHPRLRSADNEVLEGLRPPSRIECLSVLNFRGDVFPSWFKLENLPAIRILELSCCLLLRRLSVSLPPLEQLVLKFVGIEVLTTSVDVSTCSDRMQHGSINSSSGIRNIPLTSLSTLRLVNCQSLINIDQFLSPENLPSVKSIELVCCRSLLSIPVHKFGGFACLQDLKIDGCDRLVCTREMVLPLSLRRLSICNCGELDKSFRPSSFQNLASLTLLHLSFCDSVELIPLNSINTNMLKCLLFRCCSELSSIGGSHALSSVQHVDIFDCPKLTEVKQPFKKKKLMPKEEKELLKFIH